MNSSLLFSEYNNDNFGGNVNNNQLSGFVLYIPNCIFCLHEKTLPLMNDGGCFRKCINCKKNFRANVLNKSIQNYSYTTSHLKGTN
jgi:hypothetical protein